MLHPIVIFVQYNIYDIFCCKCGSKEREAPPRAALARLPPPLLALASDQRSSDGGEGMALLTIVGRWSPCPILQPPFSSSRNRLSHGGWGAETPVLL